jgi:predicted nucleic acid-binding protein
MAATRRSLLDSFAMLAFLNDERPAVAVERLLRNAETSGEPLLMNEINIGEVYYVTAKRRSRNAAETFLELLSTLPIAPVPNEFGDVLAAARIKAEYAVSYADAFAIATAVRRGAVLVTGDPEIFAVEPLIKIQRL